MAPDGSVGGFAGPDLEAAPGILLRTGGDADTDLTEEDDAHLQAQRERVARLVELEREIVTAAAILAKANHRLLVALRAFDEQRGWEAYGRKSAADWLSWRTGMSPGIARERMRVARALGRLPSIDAALADAQISFSKARALTRVATPENESELLVTARCATAHQLERLCRQFRHVAEEQVEGRPRISRTEGRWFRTRDIGGGFARGTIQLPVEEMAEIVATVNATCAQAWSKAAEEARRSGRAQETPDGAPPVAGTVAIEAHDPPRRVPPAYHPAEVVDRSTFNRVDALLAICRAFRENPAFASRRLARAEVFVETKLETLTGTDPAPAALRDGTALSPETARRLACDAAVIPFARGEDGAVIGVGRRSRTVPAPLARALALRDRHCRFPGCSNTISLDAHHVRHWAKGGPTNLDNLALLCSFHHWCLHEGGFAATFEAGELVVRDPRGRVLENAPALDPDGTAGEALRTWLAEHGPDPETALPIPIGGNADGSLFVEGMLFRTYGPACDGSIPRLPLADGSAPPIPPDEGRHA